LALEAFQHLPATYREILVLRYDNDLGYEEIGAKLHCSPDAARMSAARARHLLMHAVIDWASHDSG
jgi:DNA-directed RNA polymerase specialized sigma24 family protein